MLTTEYLDQLKGAFIVHESGEEWKINSIQEKIGHGQEGNRPYSVVANCKLWSHREFANKGYGVTATITLNSQMTFEKVNGRKVKNTVKVKNLIPDLRNI